MPRNQGKKSPAAIERRRQKIAEAEARAASDVAAGSLPRMPKEEEQRLRGEIQAITVAAKADTDAIVAALQSSQWVQRKGGLKVLDSPPPSPRALLDIGAPLTLHVANYLLDLAKGVPHPSCSLLLSGEHHRNGWFEHEHPLDAFAAEMEALDKHEEATGGEAEGEAGHTNAPPCHGRWGDWGNHPLCFCPVCWFVHKANLLTARRGLARTSDGGGDSGDGDGGDGDDGSGDGDSLADLAARTATSRFYDEIFDSDSGDEDDRGGRRAAINAYQSAYDWRS